MTFHDVTHPSNKTIHWLSLMVSVVTIVVMLGGGILAFGHLEQRVEDVVQVQERILDRLDIMDERIREESQTIAEIKGYLKQFNGV